MANSAVSICSNALLMLGSQTIASFDEASDRARQCSNLYPTVRDYVLSAHPWNCCIKRVRLNPDVTVPAFDWALQYTLPADFARILQVGEYGSEVDYNLEFGADGSKKLLMDNSPLRLRYVFNNTNEGSWTPLLVMSVTLAMRQVLAYPVTQSTSLEELVSKAIAPILKQARAIDGADQPPVTVGDFRLLNSRFGSGSSTSW